MLPAHGEVDGCGARRWPRVACGLRAGGRAEVATCA